MTRKLLFWEMRRGGQGVDTIDTQGNFLGLFKAKASLEHNDPYDTGYLTPFWKLETGYFCSHLDT